MYIEIYFTWDIAFSIQSQFTWNIKAHQKFTVCKAKGNESKIDEYKKKMVDSWESKVIQNPDCE